MADWYVRRENKYQLADNPANTISKNDIERASLYRFRKHFPGIDLSNELIKAVYQRAIEDKHSNAEQSIQVWDGTFVCRPDDHRRIIPNDGFVTLNTWRRPRYRDLLPMDTDTSWFDQFLEASFPHEPDRRVFTDWLSWNLQYEAKKPGWAIFLCSRSKGTGKSTLCQLVTRLFGEQNSFTQNSVEKITSRFNLPMLQSKLVVSEELKLKSDSSQGNTLKTYITEEVTSSEAKGREVQRVRQYCCFLFTSNHLPMWIEADDRRYYVIDVDHDGHASGPRAKEFREMVGRVRQRMDDEKSLAALYLRLMKHQQAGEFDPTSLNLATMSNPIMRQIQSASRQVALEQLEEHLAAIKQFAVPQEDLVEFLKKDMGSNVNRLRHLMIELRWRNEKVKWGAKDYARSIWVHPGYWVDRGHVHGPDGYKSKIVDNSGGFYDIDVEIIDE